MVAESSWPALSSGNQSSISTWLMGVKGFLKLPWRFNKAHPWQSWHLHEELVRTSTSSNLQQPALGMRAWGSADLVAVWAEGTHPALEMALLQAAEELYSLGELYDDVFVIYEGFFFFPPPQHSPYPLSPWPHFKSLKWFSVILVPGYKSLTSQQLFMCLQQSAFCAVIWKAMRENRYKSIM